MFNKKEFIRAVEDVGETLQGVADACGISLSTLYRKMNEESDFFRHEMQIIAKIIGYAKFKAIFFPDYVA